MKVWTSKMLAVSLAGHDKGTVYVVLEEMPGCTDAQEAGQRKERPDGSIYYMLSDGKRRTLDHPKMKKAKHTQVITHLPEALLERMQEITLDAHVRKILKEYNHSL